MTESIFANGGQFCMRGDELRRPVEWHLFTGATDLRKVVFMDSDGAIRACGVDGRYWNGGEHERDLIPIPSPPQIVPWESPDDVPDGIWIRGKHNGILFSVTEFIGNSVTFRTLVLTFLALFEDYEYHTDRRATSGWQPCGKVVK